MNIRSQNPIQIIMKFTREHEWMSQQKYVLAAVKLRSLLFMKRAFLPDAPRYNHRVQLEDRIKITFWSFDSCLGISSYSKGYSACYSNRRYIPLNIIMWMCSFFFLSLPYFDWKLRSSSGDWNKKILLKRKTYPDKFLLNYNYVF